MNWWSNIIKKYAKLENELSNPSISKEDLINKSKELGQLSGDYQMACDATEVDNELIAVQEMIMECGTDSAFVKELLVEQKRLEGKLRSIHYAYIKAKEKSVSEQALMLEIRPGAGGAEAGIFAYNLLEMYLRYAQSLNFHFEVISKNETDVEGLREAVIHIKGDNAYEEFKFESGVHRVQRIPKTEASGRIHTSTATVAVLEEQEDVDVQINLDYLKVDVYRSSGPGGQSVNTTDSAVRLTYSHPELDMPVVVCMQDEKSQHKNKEKAMKVLKVRVMDFLKQKQMKEVSDTRKQQVGSGDRSERVRTYNFPQDRITDHRSKFTVHGLSEIFLMTPNTLQKVIHSLKQHYLDNNSNTKGTGFLNI
ncbi:MAG: PCRF domain-containing protein [Alphaproteobacteria bacterium]|nr:MAG: PCRF domain-containing protein [Alphaproteobacteria bacterium]